MTDASFDTNILIDCLNGVEAARRELRRVQQRWISRISWIEVLAGADSLTAQAVEGFLAQFLIDEVTEIIGRRTAALRAEQRSLSLPDALILATAQIHGRILVTRNTRDFPANLPGIRVPYTL
ncbi:PIN domain-containing protein [Thermaurantiacus sp.]